MIAPVRENPIKDSPSWENVGISRIVSDTGNSAHRLLHTHNRLRRLELVTTMSQLHHAVSRKRQEFAFLGRWIEHDPYLRKLWPDIKKILSEVVKSSVEINSGLMLQLNERIIALLDESEANNDKTWNIKLLHKEIINTLYQTVMKMRFDLTENISKDE